MYLTGQYIYIHVHIKTLHTQNRQLEVRIKNVFFLFLKILGDTLPQHEYHNTS